MIAKRAAWLWGAAGLWLVLAAGASGQTSTVDEIAKYRAALQDGNPADLWELRGEALWKQKRGTSAPAASQA